MRGVDDVSKDKGLSMQSLRKWRCKSIAVCDPGCVRREHLEEKVGVQVDAVEGALASM